MEKLEWSAELLKCYLRSVLQSNQKVYALFDIDTNQQCSPFYTIEQWSVLNEASVVLDYTSKNPIN